MGYDDNEPLCLEGSLILADPSMRESGFARSVLLLTNHSPDDGAVGFIMNKPTGKSVGELLTVDARSGLADIPVLFGGPVSPDQLTFACFAWDSDECSLDFSTQLSIADATHRLHEGYSVRAFVGYAGWSAGQLESELKLRAWITGRPEPLLIDPDATPTLWTALLRKMGPWFHLLSATPDDPSLN